MNLTLQDFCNAGRFDGEFDALAALLIEHRPMMTSERLRFSESRLTRSIGARCYIGVRPRPENFSLIPRARSFPSRRILGKGSLRPS